MTGAVLREKRRRAGLAGQLVCRRARMSRSRLCAIERGYVRLSREEAQRIAAAIDHLSQARMQLMQLASHLGCPEFL